MTYQTTYPYQNIIIGYSRAKSVASLIHKRAKSIVMVSGCYDIVHLGHARFLFDAKKLGDVLIVSVGSDINIKAIKGPDRPVMNQDYRASMIASLKPVDYVVIDDEPLRMPSRINFEVLLGMISPDIFAVNSTDSSIELKRALVGKYGTKLEVIDVESTTITSTTEILEIIRKL